MESLATAVLLTDHSLKITFANSAAEQLFITSRSRLMTLKLTDLFDKSQKAMFDSIALSLKPHATGFNASDVLICPEPYSMIRTDVFISPYAGKGRGLVVEFKGMDHQQKINQEVSRRTQHLAARDLVRSLAHEIKNPLGGIRGAAQLIEMTFGKLDGCRDISEYTQVIINETDRLKNLVDKLLGPQRPNPLTRANIHYAIEKVLALETMEAGGDIRFQKDYDPSLPELMLDTEAMQQVLINIVSNAIQALHETHTPHAQITLRTRAQIGGRVINGIKYSTVIVISVIDNGPGIPEAIRDTLFYPMVTAKQGGNGLGLSIAQSIVERHNGLIECDSEKGHTVFRIILPLRKDSFATDED